MDFNVPNANAEFPNSEHSEVVETEFNHKPLIGFLTKLAEYLLLLTVAGAIMYGLFIKLLGNPLDLRNSIDNVPSINQKMDTLKDYQAYSIQLMAQDDTAMTKLLNEQNVKLDRALVLLNLVLKTQNASQNPNPNVKKLTNTEVNHVLDSLFRARTRLGSKYIPQLKQ